MHWTLVAHLNNSKFLPFITSNTFLFQRSRLDIKKQENRIQKLIFNKNPREFSPEGFYFSPFSFFIFEFMAQVSRLIMSAFQIWHS